MARTPGRQPGSKNSPRPRDANGVPITLKGRRLSDEPSAIRRRLRKNAAGAINDIELLYGKPLHEWTLEELGRGRPKNADGTWKGRNAEWTVSPILHEIQNRLVELTTAKVNGQAANAISVIRKLMLDTSVDDNGRPIVEAKVKLDAAKFIINHIIGTPKTRVDLHADDAVKKVMAAALVMPDHTPAHPIIEGSIVEEGDDDEE
jgi:hypothetical protein